jgi:hypothetical protein
MRVAQSILRFPNMGKAVSAEMAPVVNAQAVIPSRLDSPPFTANCDHSFMKDAA